MKIRWNGNSIRFRIMPSELAALERGDAVTEEIVFPGGRRWRATLEPSAAGTRLWADDGGVFLTLASADRDRLAAPDAEGVYFTPADGESPRFFIEKDFPCAHPRAIDAQEAQPETFAAPPGFEERKAAK